MGYLNKQTVTVDAILTKKGRELLSSGQSAFQIRKFAVADDEIDYGLYDLAHPLGSEYYGSTIENMPIVEASPDETQNLRYKLVTLTRNSEGVNRMPVIDAIASIELTYNSVVKEIKPVTITQDTGIVDTSYTAILYNRDAVTIIGSGQGNISPTGRTANAISSTAQVVQGTTFTVEAKDVDTLTETFVRIIGNTSGATVTIPIQVSPEVV